MRAAEQKIAEVLSHQLSEVAKKSPPQDWAPEAPVQSAGTRPQYVLSLIEYIKVYKSHRSLLSGALCYLAQPLSLAGIDKTIFQILLLCRTFSANSSRILSLISSILGALLHSLDLQPIQQTNFPSCHQDGVKKGRKELVVPWPSRHTFSRKIIVFPVHLLSHALCDLILVLHLWAMLSDPPDLPPSLHPPRAGTTISLWLECAAGRTAEVHKGAFCAPVPSGGPDPDAVCGGAAHQPAAG